MGYVWREICVGYVWCEIRQQSSEEPCDETSFGKKKRSKAISCCSSKDILIPLRSSDILPYAPLCDSQDLFGRMPSAQKNFSFVDVVQGQPARGFALLLKSQGWDEKEARTGTTDPLECANHWKRSVVITLDLSTHVDFPRG